MINVKEKMFKIIKKYLGKKFVKKVKSGNISSGKILYNAIMESLDDNFLKYYD